MRTCPARALLLAAALAMTSSAATGQGAPVEAGMHEVPGLAGTLQDTPTSELTLRLAPLTADELQALGAVALDRLRTLADELSGALIEQQRAHARSGASDGDRAAADERVSALIGRKAELVSRVEIVLDALKAKGGDVESARAYVGVVRGMEPAITASDAEPAELSEAEQAQAALAAAAGRTIADVREEAPGHERPMPWTVPVSELELELQPLRVAQLDERVQKWLEILQREVRKRIRIDIAMSRAEGDLRGELAARSAEQQEVVKAVVARLKVALRALRDRGGKVGEYEDYIADATGQKFSLDPAVLYARAMTWLTSREGGVQLGLNIVKFLGTLVVFFVLARILGAAVATAVNRLPKASALLREFLVTITKRMTVIIGLVMAVGTLGINITPLVAAIGAAGLVIGFALQGTLSNFASGILILVYRPYDIGDFIKGGGVSGKVESMSLVSTSILTPDNQVMIVPNNEIWNGVITNVTGRDTRRVDLVFGIGYGDDIATAVAVLEEELKRHEKVLADPAPMVKVSALGDNSVNLIARPWARTSDYWEVFWDLTRRVKERFDEAGLNIPFPQRDLHVPGTIEVRLAREDG